VNAALAGGRPACRPSAADGRDSAAFRDAMSELAGGVAVVTCRVDGRPWATTVTAFQSVSVEPPTVLVSLGSGTRAAAAIAHDGCFGINLLAADQVVLACLAAKPGAPKYVEQFTTPGSTESAAPAVEGALAHLECALFDAVEVAGQTVFFAHVLQAHASGSGHPLLYHRRGYRTLRSHEGDRHAHG
jgi:flavin reductase (DIM6/NTAB) family NADH-FMN oxidoreductase RutF